MSKVSALLKRFSFLREYKVISDIDLLVDNKPAHIDHLMLGEFGILCVTCFDKKGELYGNESDKSFVIVDAKMNRHPVENPVERAKCCESVIRKNLADLKIYNVKISSAVVIENSRCKLLVSETSIPILPLEKLKKLLNSGKFDMNFKADKQKIAEAFLKYSK